MVVFMCLLLAVLRKQNQDHLIRTSTGCAPSCPFFFLQSTARDSKEACTPWGLKERKFCRAPLGQEGAQEVHSFNFHSFNEKKLINNL
jgi:hypothetical protein